MSYSPDGDPNIDPNDLEAVEAFLNDPVVQALHDDLGRQFASLPPEEQVEEVATQMMKLQALRDELVVSLDDAPAEDPRLELLNGLDGHLAQYRRRLEQLRDHPPD